MDSGMDISLIIIWYIDHRLIIINILRIFTDEYYLVLDI